MLLAGAAAPTASQAADSCPNAAVRAEQHTERLPECRAYEQVTPADKNQGWILYGSGAYAPEIGGATQPSVSTVTAGGDVASFFSYGAFADPTTGHYAQYRAFRTDAGWQTKPWSPAIRTPHPVIANGQTIMKAVSEDLSVGFSESADNFDPLEQRPEFYLDVYAVRDPGSISWISRGNDATPDTAPISAHLIQASGDGSTVAFRTTERLVPLAGTQLPDANLTYVRRNGVTRLLNEDDGSPLGVCGADPGGQYNPDDESGLGLGALSRDGRYVFLTTPTRFNQPSDCLADSTRVYLRDLDGGGVVEISRSQRATPDTTADVTFLGATPDASVAYLTSTQALTDGALPGPSMKLYRYDVAQRRLTLVTGPAAGSIANFPNLAGLARDGRSGYVWASSGDDTARGIYRIAGDTFTRIAPYPSVVGTMRAKARVTPDGRFLLLFGDDNLTSYDAHGTDEAYRYDARDGTWICVSCRPDGAPPAGPARPGGDTSTNGVPNYPLIRNITDDGSRITFETFESLDPRDTNKKVDTYQWVDGRTWLVSSGTSEVASPLFGVSADGSSVFFATIDGLVPQDVDRGDMDVYAARVDGGFASPTPATPCEGDDCQGAAAPQAPSAISGTARYVGSGDAPSPRRVAAPVPTIAVRAPARVTAREAKVRVKASAAGRVTLSGTSVRSQRKQVKKASTVTVRVALTAGASAKLARSGRLKVLVTLKFAAADGRSAKPKKATITFVRRARTGGAR